MSNAIYHSKFDDTMVAVTDQIVQCNKHQIDSSEWSLRLAILCILRWSKRGLTEGELFRPQRTDDGQGNEIMADTPDNRLVTRSLSWLAERGAVEFDKDVGRWIATTVAEPGHARPGCSATYVNADATAEVAALRLSDS